MAISIICCTFAGVKNIKIKDTMYKKVNVDVIPFKDREEYRQWRHSLLGCDDSVSSFSVAEANGKRNKPYNEIYLKDKGILSVNGDTRFPEVNWCSPEVADSVFPEGHSDNVIYVKMYIVDVDNLKAVEEK